MQAFDGFASPRQELEQYATSPNLAARMLHIASFQYDDIWQKAVIDLGCGCGILSLGARLLGAGMTIGVDIDIGALQTAARNASKVDESLDFIQADLLNCGQNGPLSIRFLADTVIMNPPFGTKNKGADISFLSVACHIAKTAVYSMHKTSTRKFVVRKAAQWGWQASVLAEVKFEIKACYKHHSMATRDVIVDIIRFKRLHKI